MRTNAKDIRVGNPGARGRELFAALDGAEAMHFLTGLTEPAMLGTGYIYDLRTLGVERCEVVPETDCPVCVPSRVAVAER